MKISTLAPILAEHPLLEGLPTEYVELMAGCASNVRFQVGESIFRQGESADRFFLVRHGDVSVEVNTPGRGAVSMATVHAGEILGWSWLVPPYRWSFDARAISMTRVIAFDGKCLRDKCAENHDLGYELLYRVTQVMSDRLTAARMQILDMYGQR